MLSLLLAGIFMVFSVSAYQFSFNYMSVQRAYLGLYKGIVETCVIAYDGYGNDIVPYFATSLLKAEINQYFKTSLEKYDIPYSVTYDFYRASTMRKTSSNPDCVMIGFFAEVTSISRYEKTAKFTITKCS